MNTTYTIQTEDFKGPFELLLDLIEKKKLSINQISLKEVADGYIEYLKKLEHLPLEETAHFLLVASALIFLKSVSLLPTLTLTEEERGSIDELERRLKEYREIRRLSEHIKVMYGQRKIFWSKKIFSPTPVFSPDKKTTIPELSKILFDCLATLPSKDPIPEATVLKVMSLEEMIDALRDRIQTSLTMSFKELSGHTGVNIGKKEKLNVVISFLAILELIKQEVINATQEETYKDIIIEHATKNI